MAAESTMMNAQTGAAQTYTRSIEEAHACADADALHTQHPID
jgi:hypothetical protein